METDIIKLLCSGNPLEQVVALLKEQLTAAITAAKGAITGAIKAVSDKLKAGLKGLIPSLPSKPSFLADLLAVKSAIEGDIVAFQQKAAALIEKWGKVVADIKTLIENLANLNICDLMHLNFKMGPNGVPELVGPPPKTATGPPEKAAAAEITTKNNLPQKFASKTDAANAQFAAIDKIIQNSAIAKAYFSTSDEVKQINLSKQFIAVLNKAEQQGIPADNDTLQNLTDGERSLQSKYISLIRKQDEYIAGKNACQKTIINTLQKIDREIGKETGNISSEYIDSVISQFAVDVETNISHTVNTAEVKTKTYELRDQLSSFLKTNWKTISEQRAMQIGINEVTLQTGQKFTDWFNSQGFKYLTAGSFVDYFSRVRNGVKNSEPPSHLWPNIVPTIRLVEKLKETLGGNITVNSSYRSPAYNAAIGGASGGYHLTFQALDIHVDGVSPATVFATLKSWRNQGIFRGGLGTYSTFTHVDTRGSNATWNG